MSWPTTFVLLSVVRVAVAADIAAEAAAEAAVADVPEEGNNIPLDGDSAILDAMMRQEFGVPAHGDKKSKKTDVGVFSKGHLLLRPRGHTWASALKALERKTQSRKIEHKLDGPEAQELDDKMRKMHKMMNMLSALRKQRRDLFGRLKKKIDANATVNGTANGMASGMPREADDDLSSLYAEGFETFRRLYRRLTGSTGGKASDTKASLDAPSFSSVTILSDSAPTIGVTTIYGVLPLLGTVFFLLWFLMPSLTSAQWAVRNWNMKQRREAVEGRALRSRID